jgi:hypothetical protein
MVASADLRLNFCLTKYFVFELKTLIMPKVTPVAKDNIFPAKLRCREIKRFTRIKANNWFYVVLRQ